MITIKDPVMMGYLLFVAGVFGAIFGSFLNCMAYRIVHHESFLKGKSHCDSCGHELGAKDLVPILSYVFQKGRCRYCGKKMGARFVLSEILLCVVFVSIVWKYGVSFDSLRYLGLACALFSLSFVDLDIQEIPDGYIIFGIIWWIVTAPLVTLGQGGSVHDMLMSLLGGAIGGFGLAIGMLLISLLFDKIMGRDSLGGGDIKLFFVVGLYVGIAIGLFDVILSCVIGLILAICVRKEMIPFGPSIALSTWICVLVGAQFVTWYISLF